MTIHSIVRAQSRYKMYVNGWHPCAIRDMMVQREVPISAANKLLSQCKIRELRSDRGNSHGQRISVEVPTGVVIKNSTKKNTKRQQFR